MVEKIVADYPDSPQYLGDLVGVLFRSGQPKEALGRYAEWINKKKQQPGIDVDSFGQVMLTLATMETGAPKITVDNVQPNEQRFYNVINQWNAMTLSVYPFYGLEGGPYGFNPPIYAQGPDLSGSLSNYDPDAYVLRREGLKKLDLPARPEDATLHWVARMRGQAVLHQWDKAVASAEQAVRSSPDDHTLLLERGRIFRWCKNWEKAAADCEAAIRQHPNDAAGWFERGCVLALQERWMEAAADFDKALSKPENTLYSGMAGPVDIRTEILRWDPVFTELTRLRPNDAELWLARGRSLNQKGKTADALTAYSKAISVQPDNILSYFERAAIHVQESHWDAAAADYVKMFDLAEEKPDLAPWKGNAWNGIASNEQILAKAMELRPDNLEFVTYHANWLAGRNELEPALRGYARVLEKKPERNDVRLDRARLYARFGRWDEAIADFTKAVGDGALNDDWFQLAACQLLARHDREYEELYNKTSKMRAPNAPPGDCAPRVLALGPVDEQAREHALKWAEENVTAQPNIAWHLHICALAHYRAGQYDQAIQRVRESQTVGAPAMAPGGGASAAWGGPLNSLLLALCYQALNQPEDVYGELHLVEAWLDKFNKETGPAGAKLAPLSLPLSDWLEYLVLKRDAERVFGAGAP
jgi:tetratricopeptide (TPR) repeat protein